MKRLINSIPLVVISALLFASVAAAQQGAPDPNAAVPYAADPNAAVPYADPNAADPYAADPNAADPYAADTSTPEEPVVEHCGAEQGVGGGDFRMVSITIQPSSVSHAPTYVDPGTTVRWMNGDTRPHTVTAEDGSFDSGALKQGETCSRKFDEPGEWKYYDRKHPDRTGSIIVGK